MTADVLIPRVTDDKCLALFRARLRYAQKLRDQGDRTAAELVEDIAYSLFDADHDA